MLGFVEVIKPDKQDKNPLKKLKISHVNVLTKYTNFLRPESGDRFDIAHIKIYEM